MIATLDTAHKQWHLMHGKYAVCDLDCGASESVAARFEDDHQALVELAASTGHLGIRCGCCKGRHFSVDMVKFCYAVEEDAKTFERNEAAMLAVFDNDTVCEHGMSQALCVGPSHYPMDSYDD